jgi:hypothetical protein
MRCVNLFTSHAMLRCLCITLLYLDIAPTAMLFNRSICYPHKGTKTDTLRNLERTVTYGMELGSVTVFINKHSKHTRGGGSGYAAIWRTGRSSVRYGTRLGDLKNRQPTHTCKWLGSVSLKINTQHTRATSSGDLRGKGFST